MKSLVAYWVADLIRLRREGWKPDRDVILALTADEEHGATDHNGVRWLLAHQPALIQAELALNEGGGGELKDGRRRSNDVQASEKGYLSFRLEVRNKGGHSSLPEKDNAIFRLAAGLARLERHDSRRASNPVVRAYLARLGTIEQGPLAADMRAVAATPAGATLDPPPSRASRRCPT